MNRLFYNLLTNALKFRRTGIPPQVRISCLDLPPEQDRHYSELSLVKT